MENDNATSPERPGLLAVVYTMREKVFISSKIIIL